MRVERFLHREVEFIPILGGRINLVEIKKKARGETMIEDLKGAETWRSYSG